ncbi:MAG: SDR family NAD(P)-dependent oxidoreductase [Myxococcales bacterium]|nr:MAG: SDR family NAD(P)-dependent oxidoreductase [Myxococcales bacterium]
MKLQNRVAFITGASRGIGRSIALGLAREGCDIIVAARTTEVDPKLPGTIGDVAAEVEALGRRALAVRVDVRDEGEIERGVQAALDRFGRIDYLVNNAGALFWRPFVETPARRFDLVMGVNARGSFLCASHIAPAMIAQRYGHILSISPPIDLGGASTKVAYAMSKFAQTVMAHGLADELREHNVASNALWPATMVETNASHYWNIGSPGDWRHPAIMADAAVGILAKEPASFTGHALLDEDFLRAEGVTDFSPYRCDPAVEPPRRGFDFKLEIGKRGAKV